MGLEVKPNLGRPLKVTVESQSGIHSDGALAFDDLVDAARGNADVFGNAILRQAKRQQKILAKNFAGVDGGVLFHGLDFSVVVNNFNIARAVRFPAETDAPLVIDPDGILAFAIAFESFESIAGWYSQLGQFGDRMKLSELAQSSALDIRRKGADFLQPKQPGGGIAGKGADHALAFTDNNGRR